MGTRVAVVCILVLLSVLIPIAGTGVSVADESNVQQSYIGESGQSDGSYARSRVRPSTEIPAQTAEISANTSTPPHNNTKNTT